MLTSQSFTLLSSCRTDMGKKRKANQDQALCRPDLQTFAVADGMGGHQGGERAALLCVNTITDIIVKNTQPKNTQGAVSELGDSSLLNTALLAANQRVFEESEQQPELKGMGTTATVLRITGNIATLAQVGDSRAYYWNRDGIWQVTRDHSLVEEKLRAGLISREQLKTDEMKNVITRSVGYESSLRVDTYTVEITTGDGFLLCSDGLSGPLDEQTLFSYLEGNLKSNHTLDQVAEKLIAAANDRGGDDNITVVLVQIGQIES